MSARPWETQREPTRAEKHAAQIGVEFDADNHLYRIGDRRLISVTQTLLHAGYTSWDHVSDFYRERGSAAHKAVHYSLDREHSPEGDLDREHLAKTAEQGAPALLPFVDAAAKFIRENDIEIVMPESVVVSKSLGFAGTIDAMGYVRGSKRLVIIDWKTSSVMRKVYGIQTMGYALAWFEMSHELVAHRYGVSLLPSGDYKVKEFTDRRDEGRFLSGLGTVQTRLYLETLTPQEIWPNAA